MSWTPGQDNGLSGPYRSAKAVTPSDTDNLPDGVCSALYIAGNGNVEVLLEGDSAPVVIAMTAGWNNVAKLLVRRVLSGSTTATGILALY